ncbi:recombinase RecT [Acidihalobacter ferrooxydans]|uniref:Recombinase RecT n=1 Tax=Acidihalobacter ferrooxydans TaxID=1765967 RepID=A0A1P8UFJ4_9GAMM|nr:recombinase RecT [Acidihalobacter ferrooxydans]APZ42612.1 hypothetical protein BW247_05465 [Acidihalobacter ferrooxydans]
MANEMQQRREVPPWRQMILKSKDPFQEIARRTGLDFSSEQVFAVQACLNNSMLAETANKNPDSLRLALLNSAAVGISINPAEKLAYLVPRDGQVILDISYRGLIKIAADIGAIKWAKAELVYAQDRFVSRGPGQAPLHEYDPFENERGEFRGAYCLAKLPDGSMLVEFMKAADIWKVRDMSMLYARKKKGPWVDWRDEMIKKTVIKRAAKTWPHSGGRLAEAIQILNDQGEGLPAIEGESTPVAPPNPDNASEQTRKTVSMLVERAVASKMWAAAEQYVTDRFEHPDDRAYAIRAIRAAKSQHAQAEEIPPEDIPPPVDDIPPPEGDAINE